ncbi:MAG TPA: lantibiotic dehydratase, partial [Thermoanaerobaculia bacterium]|nr:lantibiotic dehydratase [Thermoanaerobaculia bacterium]
MDAFSQDRLLETLAERARLCKRLDEMRAALVDHLYGAIRTGTREERRWLLLVKRSCYNARSLKTFLGDPRWPLLVDGATALVHDVITLEEALDEVRAKLDELYRRTLQGERESIVQLLARRAFVRGVALASPTVAQSLGRLNGRESARAGRREKRLYQTLLRYASRAALKLSPFSTLTRTGLGQVAGDSPADLVLLPATAWRVRSTVSLRRELLAQCSCLLLRCPGFAERLEVALNETLSFDGDGRCSLFRPGRWVLDEHHAFRYHEASMVRARLGGPLVPWLIDELRAGPQILGRLFAHAEAVFDDESPGLTRQAIIDLLAIGLLSPILPWSFSEPDLERQILSYLDTLPENMGLEAFRDNLRELVQLLDSYAEAVAPAPVLNAIQRGVERLFYALAPTAGLTPEIDFKAHAQTFEEDVFLEPSVDRVTAPEIARLSQSRARALLEELEPLARLGDLYSGHYDLLHTLAAFAKRHWPGIREVGLMEIFGAAQPLFEEYLRCRARSGGSAFLRSEFDPLSCASIGSLSHWRKRIDEEVDTCFRDAGTAQQLCPQALGALLDQVPSPYARARAFCAFLQPIDGGGREWVLNTVADGFGRFGSRFTAAMNVEARQRWVASFLAFSFLDLDGERVELVELACPGPRTVNVRSPHTQRVLVMPGESSTLPRERLLHLNDLRVQLRGADSSPVLVDAAGQRLFPLLLGSWTTSGRPTLLKFLAFFGPGELRWRAPVRASRTAEGVDIIDRHTLGHIVYSRKKWVLKPQTLLSHLAGCGEMEAFAVINEWRSARNIPERLFVKEPVVAQGSFYH